MFKKQYRRRIKKSSTDNGANPKLREVAIPLVQAKRAVLINNKILVILISHSNLSWQ